MYWLKSFLNYWKPEWVTTEISFSGPRKLFFQFAWKCSHMFYFIFMWAGVDGLFLSMSPHKNVQNFFSAMLYARNLSCQIMLTYDGREIRIFFLALLAGLDRLILEAGNDRKKWKSHCWDFPPHLFPPFHFLIPRMKSSGQKSVL